jgi:hypothetical protein
VDDDNEVAGKIDRMSHSGGMQATATALPYHEQLREVTAKDVLLSRRCCGLAAKKMGIHIHPLRSS